MVHRQVPVGVRAIIIVNIVGWVATIGFWLFLYSTNQVPPIRRAQSFFEKSYIGVVYGFTVNDFLWTQLLSLISIVGLYKMRLWGWTATMMLNAAWIYTSTFTIVRDLFVTITGGMIFFSLFAVYSFISTFYLWQKRKLFS